MPGGAAAAPAGDQRTGANSGIQLFTKTGTDAGVGADVGLVCAPGRTLVYAAVANWSPAAGAQDAVLASMRAIGDAVRAAVAG